MAEAAAGPMEAWSEERVQAWLGTLGLDDTEAVQRAFADDDVDGDEMVHLTLKMVGKLLRRVGVADADGALAERIVAGRDALLLPASPVIPESPTPHSARYWAQLLFDPAREAERLAALQRAADTWSPGRWGLAGQELGHGSSGVVVRCTDKRLGPVAIKFSIAPEPLRLEREAALMQRVAHENICSLREHRLLEGGLFGMVLELMEGGSLQQQILDAPDHRLPEAEVTEMALQVLRGLQFMHEKGVIHRDVKPSNIMMRSAETGGESTAAAVRYKLIDLSIAAMDGDARGAELETMLQTGTTGLAMMIGTPHFMSPEQFTLGVKVTPQTDLWSLAVTMYQALSGGLPFAAGEADRNRIGYAIVNTPSPWLTDAAGCAVPESLSDCVAKAMQKDLAQRYPTAADMATALRLATELPSRWAAMDSAINCTRVPILQEADADLWSGVEARIAESLPDFALVGMERVQNKALWRKYSTYCAGQEVVDEHELFHYAPPEALDKILSSSSVGFDPRLGGGEYGAGAYFAQHAVYSVAYSAGWLSDDMEKDAQGRVVRVVRNRSIERERAADPTVTLIWARVALGHCKDFGARCRSDRGNAAADAAGVGRHLNDEDDWGPAIGRGGANGYHRPPPRGATELYDSVSGTEGDLAWAQHPRLRDEGAKLGRQYITFDTNQAYPELVLRLERRPEVTRRFAYAAEQEALGKDNKEMAHGTTVYVQGFPGLGVVCPGYTRNKFSANSHSLRFADGERQLNLREHTWHVVGDASAALATLFESDPEAFWARVGEGCADGYAWALAAVRAACVAVGGGRWAWATRGWARCCRPSGLCPPWSGSISTATSSGRRASGRWARRCRVGARCEGWT
eukprot:COSAG01_NODE_787_length_13598_cov_17.218535_4_plen_860_part_00